MTKDIDDIQLMHKTKSYPPRIKMTFATPQHPLKIHVRVEGTSKDEQLSADFLLFPFGDSGRFSLAKIIDIPIKAIAIALIGMSTIFHTSGPAS